MNELNLLEYKGYHTRVECSIEDGVLFGKIEGIRDLVTFECDTIAEAEKAFQTSVDDYLAFCKDIGKEPEKEYKGVFQVRIDPNLHRAAAIEAFKREISLNALISEAIQEKVQGGNKTEFHVHLQAAKSSGYEPVEYLNTRRSITYGAKS